MITSLTIDELENYLLSLVINYIPDGYIVDYPLKDLLKLTMKRVEYCFSKIHRKYYFENGHVIFDHLNTDHMASFLFFLGNTIWKTTGDIAFPTRLFYLNKILHGLDLYFSVPMPQVFLLVHPVGTVIGKAQYCDYLVIYQNCTIGSSENIYPKLETGVILYSGVSIIGNCNINNNTIFGANAFILNTNVPSNTLVLGQYPKHTFKPNHISVIQRCFKSL